MSASLAETRFDALRPVETEPRLSDGCSVIFYEHYEQKAEKTGNFGVFFKNRDLDPGHPLFTEDGGAEVFPPEVFRVDFANGRWVKVISFPSCEEYDGKPGCLFPVMFLIADVAGGGLNSVKVVATLEPGTSHIAPLQESVQPALHECLISNLSEAAKRIPSRGYANVEIAGSRQKKDGWTFERSIRPFNGSFPLDFKREKRGIAAANIPCVSHNSFRGFSEFFDETNGEGISSQMKELARAAEREKFLQSLVDSGEKLSTAAVRGILLESPFWRNGNDGDLRTQAIYSFTVSEDGKIETTITSKTSDGRVKNEEREFDIVDETPGSSVEFSKIVLDVWKGKTKWGPRALSDSAEKLRRLFLETAEQNLFLLKQMFENMMLPKLKNFERRKPVIAFLGLFRELPDIFNKKNFFLEKFPDIVIGDGKTKTTYLLAAADMSVTGFVRKFFDQGSLSEKEIESWKKTLDILEFIEEKYKELPSADDRIMGTVIGLKRVLAKGLLDLLLEEGKTEKTAGENELNTLLELWFGCLQGIQLQLLVYNRISLSAEWLGFGNFPHSFPPRNA